MKKLLLILSAILVSVITYGASLNPYAYNLSSTWNEETQELTVRFTLNAHPNLEQYKVNDKATNSCGIQIYAIDPADPSDRYYIYGVPGDTIKAKMNAHNGGKGDSYDYTCIIPITGMSKGANPRPLPKGDLTWAVTVQGVNNQNQSTPVVVNDNIANRPYSCHGIAVNNNQNSADFGSIYVTEASNGVADNNTWGWLVDKGKSLLKYTPRLEYQTSYQKAPRFSDRNIDANCLEPHRVRISDDGRIFVSSYNRNTSDDQVAVWELKNGVYTPVIYHNTYGGAQGVYGDRVCGMDVKGSGGDLRILLCFLDEYDGNYANAFRIYEYDLNNLGAKNNEGSWKCSYRPDGNTYEVSGNKVISAQSALDAARRFKWYFYSDGFANVAYGKKNKNDIFLSIDYCQGVTYNASIVYFKDGATKSTSIQNVNSTNHYYGGGGFVPIVEGDNEYIVSSRTKDGGSGTFPESNGYIHTYPINGTTISTSPRAEYTLSNIKSETAINDMAMDCANNLYAVSFTDGSKGTGRLIAIAMPYGGATTTVAPKGAEGTTFTLKPIPNILATDLRFAPDGNSDRYVFSFNVNTTPQVAQIRFYKSYGDNGENDMKKNLAKINADDYQGGNAITPSFVYDIPTDQLKQGKISVSLGMCGGTIEDGKITNGKLPRGEWYWSVYVEAPRKSSVFAPIYRLVGQTHATEGHERKHATVNNYPETDGFGNIIVAHNPSGTTNDATRPEKGLRIYGISDSGNDEHAFTNTDRYSLRATYLNKNATEGILNYPRRMAVAPDGKVYIADEGSATNYSSDTKDPLYNYWRTLSDEKPYVLHEHGGVKIWDPDNPNKFTLFTDNRLGTSTGVAIWNGKLYATNTYDEYVKHINSSSNYTKEQQAEREIGSGYGWNGFAEYILNKYTAPGDWSSWNNNVKEYALNRGDASGNCAIVAMDQGIWMCQHREHTVKIKEYLCEPMADNLETYVLSFVPYNNYTSEAEYGPRTWRSCTTNGLSWSWPKNVTQTWDNAIRTETTPYSDNSQKEESPLQSTPGAGLAYKKINDKEYLYVVNHDGNIVVFEIFNWESKGTSSAKPSVKHVYTYVTPESTKVEKEVSKTLNKVERKKNWKTSFITSMCFDYAGNLVTTTGKNYHDGPQDIVVYTMPYDRVNAREIQAPNSCRYIPERVSHMDMGNQELANIINYYLESNSECYVDIFRPMFNTAFNTICLPFDVDLRQATAGAYHNATLMQFYKAVVTEVNNEKMLELQFTEKTDKIIEAGIPYLIKPENPIPGIMSLEQDIKFETIDSKDQTRTFNNGYNSITFIGIIPYQFINVTNQPLPLIVVDQNRLAEVSNGGNILGFRAYFQLAYELGPDTRVGISMRKPTPTNVITIDGKRVNIEKFLREGRVYIRVGDSLYTISGEKVE